MKQSQGRTEQLKLEDASGWVQRINNIPACAKEIAEKKIIFAQMKRRQEKISAANFLKKVLFVTQRYDVKYMTGGR